MSFLLLLRWWWRGFAWKVAAAIEMKVEKKEK